MRPRARSRLSLGRDRPFGQGVLGLAGSSRPRAAEGRLRPALTPARLVLASVVMLHALGPGPGGVVAEGPPAPTGTPGGVADAPRRLRYVPGLAWQGREWQGTPADPALPVWDFIMYSPRWVDDQTIAYQYEASRTRSTAERKGTLEIETWNLRFRGVLREEPGSARRVYEGNLLVEGERFLAIGATWVVGAKGPRARFWATVEMRMPKAPDRIDYNRTSVGVLEACGISPESARTIVHRRVIGGGFGDLSEVLSLPGLNDLERAILRQRATIQR